MAATGIRLFRRTMVSGNRNLWILRAAALFSCLYRFVLFTAAQEAKNPARDMPIGILALNDLHCAGTSWWRSATALVNLQKLEMYRTRWPSH